MRVGWLPHAGALGHGGGQYGALYEPVVAQDDEREQQFVQGIGKLGLARQQRRGLGLQHYKIGLAAGQ